MNPAYVRHVYDAAANASNPTGINFNAAGCSFVVLIWNYQTFSGCNRNLTGIKVDGIPADVAYYSAGLGGIVSALVDDSGNVSFSWDTMAGMSGSVQFAIVGFSNAGRVISAGAQVTVNPTNPNNLVLATESTAGLWVAMEVNFSDTGFHSWADTQNNIAVSNGRPGCEQGTAYSSPSYTLSIDTGGRTITQFGCIIDSPADSAFRFIGAMGV